MEPWTPSEIKMFQVLVQQRKDIIENKSIETEMVRKKNAVWNSIRNDMRAAGYIRTIVELKNCWGQIKLSIANISKITIPASWVDDINRNPVQIGVSSDMEGLYLFHANDTDAILPYLETHEPTEGPSSSANTNGGKNPAAAAVSQNAGNKPSAANPATGANQSPPSNQGPAANGEPAANEGPAANPGAASADAAVAPNEPAANLPTSANQRPVKPFVSCEKVPFPAAITNTVDSPIASGVVSTSIDSPELPLNITYVPNVSEADVFATSKTRIEQEIEQTAELHWLEVSQRKELHTLRCQQLKEEIEQQRELFKVQLKKLIDQ